jgi:hypothetical protein
MRCCYCKHASYDTDECECTKADLMTEEELNMYWTEEEGVCPYCELY